MCHTTFAVLDVETTGFHPRFDDVVEVACVVVRDGSLVSSFASLVDPGRPIPARASAVHGLRDRHVRGAPLLADLQAHIRALTRATVVVAHNLSFDLGFLPFLADRDALCTLRFARLAIAEAPDHRNQTLRRHLGLRITGDDAAHRALADATITSLVLRECNRRYLEAGYPDDIATLIAHVMRGRGRRAAA